MARKPSPPTIVDYATPTATLPVPADHDQVQANVLALAEQLGYDGIMTVGALEDEIRFYQRRSVEALLAVGTRLLLLKEQVQHGEFIHRVELLGFSDRTARRFMQAAIKTSKSANMAVLADQIGSAGKFLELVTLDDDDLEVLKDGGSMAGLTLDDVERMTVRELRAALREARENEQATGRVLAEKNTKIDQLAMQIEKRPPPIAPIWDDQIMQLSREAHDIGLVAEEAVAKLQVYTDVAEVLANKLDEDAPDFRDRREQLRLPVGQLQDQIERLATLVARLRADFEVRVSYLIDRSHLLPDVE